MSHDFLMVVAIDFGTTYSGYAFSTTSQFKHNPVEVHANQAWAGANLQSLKTPTSILINKHQELDSFGYDAEETYANKIMENTHHEYFYFQRFKMQLHGKSVNSHTILEDITGKGMKALKVFSLAISALVQHAENTIDLAGTNVLKEEIRWVLTVPAIWTDAAKQFMRTAAKDAGIKMNQLIMALEPEAASLYCQYLPIDKLGGASKGFTMSAKGTKYMIIDLGGGTADITVHEKIDNGRLKEIHRASGGASGGTAVDNLFLQNILIKVIGCPLLTKLKEKYPSNYLDLVRDFENVKRTVVPEKDSKVSVRMPMATLNELCKSENDEDFKQMLDTSPVSRQVEISGDKLRVKAEFMKGFFHSVIDEILKYLQDIMSKPSTQGVSIFLLVGGFSESKMVQHAIRKAYPDKRVIVPFEAGLAVLKGAVIYGHNPEAIALRIMRYSYGVRTTPEFDLHKHRNDKKFKQSGKDRCNDVFCGFMKAGSQVPSGHKEVAVYNTTTPMQGAMGLRIFYSPNEDPEYTDDDSCYSLGELDVKVPCPSEDQRHLAVQYTFGDTELKVTAVEVESHNVCDAEFKLL